MKDEEIEDHGDATIEDSKRMVTDIESLNFDSYLIGTLRQLVGVDLLREQEVYYLPEPGKEAEIVKKVKPDKSAVVKLSSRTLDGMSSPTSSVRSPLSSRPPISFAGSASTVSHHHNDNEGAFSESDSSDESDDEFSWEAGIPHPLKKSGSSPPQEGEPSSSQTTGKRPGHKRKRLRKDAAEYKPEEEEVSEHTDQETTPRPKVKRKNRLKRSRTVVEGGETTSDDRQIKRARTVDVIV